MISYLMYRIDLPKKIQTRNVQSSSGLECCESYIMTFTAMLLYSLAFPVSLIYDWNCLLIPTTNQHLQIDTGHQYS